MSLLEDFEPFADPIFKKNTIDSFMHPTVERWASCPFRRTKPLHFDALRAFLVENLRPLHFLVDYIGNGPKKCNGRLAKNHFLCDVMDNGVVQVVSAR